MIGSDTHNERASTFAVKEQPAMIGKGTCKHCGKYGHYDSNCYKLIDYPTNWGNCGRGRSRRVCKGYGGRATEGRGRGVERESGHCAVIETVAHTNNNNVMDQAATPGLSSEQVQKLLSLIDTPKLGYETLTGKALWMLDSGVSCHMTGDLNLIENVRDVRPIGVGLPDGKENMANKKGTVKLSKNLKLNNVLYTPDLRCNLILGLEI